MDEVKVGIGLIAATHRQHIGVLSGSLVTNDSTANSSPADALVLGLDLLAGYGYPHEIDDALVRSGSPHRIAKLGAALPTTMTSDCRQHLVDRVAEQGRQVWNLLLDVLLVGADEPRRRDVPVVDAQRDSPCRAVPQRG